MPKYEQGFLLSVPATGYSFFKAKQHQKKHQCARGADLSDHWPIPLVIVVIVATPLIRITREPCSSARSVLTSISNVTELQPKAQPGGVLKGLKHPLSDQNIDIYFLVFHQHCTVSRDQVHCKMFFGSTTGVATHSLSNQAVMNFRDLRNTEAAFFIPARSEEHTSVLQEDWNNLDQIDIFVFLNTKRICKRQKYRSDRGCSNLPGVPHCICYWIG